MTELDGVVETTLLMLVTNRDCVMAHHAVRSYGKVWKLYREFRLRIYANCLSDANKRRYFPRWRKYPYAVLVDNEAGGPIRRRKGDLFKTPEGIEMPYEDDCEHQEQIWAREQKICRTRFFGTVDADFELLSGEFVLEMLARLRADDTLAACSTAHSPTVEGHADSYSGRALTLSERWHTWCCIYKGEMRQYLDDVSPSYFETTLPDGTRYVFDSYAHFQSVLRNKFGYRLEALGDRYRSQHIHYGAFSKNRSVGPWTVWPYRWLAIAAGPGLFRSGGSLGRWLNGLGRQWGGQLFSRLFAGVVKERSVYDFG